MVNGIMVGLAAMLGGGAELPSTDRVSQEVDQFKAVYVSTESNVVRVNQIQKNNPSPFLTSASSRRCSIYINSNSDSKELWSYLLRHPDVPEKAFTAFAVGHEMAHCVAARPGQRYNIRGIFEKEMGVTFTDNHHFEETFGDLLGLAYVKERFPQYESAVREQVKKLREELAERDPQHDSSPFLKSHWISRAADMVAPASITVAEKKSASEEAL
ncbi:MAG: hypothetical protein R3194_00005 [Limnobacter sp.]|nr:hypothetical protein [Limnobacter sp.]